MTIETKLSFEFVKKLTTEHNQYVRNRMLVVTDCSTMSISAVFVQSCVANRLISCARGPFKVLQSS